MLRFTALPLLALFALSGCAADTLDGEAVGDASEALAELGTKYTSHTWASPNATRLSSWQTLPCVARFGDDFLLTGLRGYRESSWNADNYVARLHGRCAQHEDNAPFEDRTDDYVPTGVEEWSQIFRARHRWESGRTEVDERLLPVGIRLELPPYGRYVKDLGFLMQTQEELESGSDVVQATRGTWSDNGGVFGGATTILNRLVDVTLSKNGGFANITCAEREVVVGLGIRHSTNTGKIRRVRVFCRPLRDAGVF